MTLGGSGTAGGPWGTNVTYSWSHTGGLEVILEDAATPKPRFTAPVPAEDVEAVFTLTVTGRGPTETHRLAATSAPAVVTVKAAPAVTGVAIASEPDSGTTYGDGETVEVGVTFAGAATVVESGALPSIGLTVGANARSAAYARGSGTRRLVFAYKVQASDADADGVAVPANGLAPGGGKIVDAGGAAFRLGHKALADDADHKVDGSVTPVRGIAIVSVPVSGTTYGAGETVEVRVTFVEAATVVESGEPPSIGLTVGANARSAAYARGSGTRLLVFAYEVQATDADTDGVAVPANGLAPGGARIVDAGGAAFRLEHEALADDADHKADGSVTPVTGVRTRYPFGGRGMSAASDRAGIRKVAVSSGTAPA